MTALIEIFDHKDLERALKVNPQLIGINNRNLDSLKMDTNNASNIAKNLPKEILTLSLSGAKTAEDIKEMGLKFDGVLVGTALMKEENPHLMLKEAIG